MARKRSTLHPATERAVLTWIAQKRLTIASEEGFAPRSVIEKIRREREGAGEGKKSTQKFMEVYWGDGLLVHQVVLELTEVPRLVFTAYYLFARDWYWPVADQAQHIGLTKPDYWEHLGRAEVAVETGLRIMRKGPRQELATADEKGDF